MKCPDSTSYLYPTYFHTELFGILLHVAGHQWFSTNIAADHFDICVHWLSYLVNQSPYTEALFEFDADQNIAILTDAGICAAHTVASGYAFNLRKQCRSLAETRFYYEYVLSEDQISVDNSTFKTLAILPERFFVDAYAAATAFRLNAEFEQRWSRFHDHRWRRH